MAASFTTGRSVQILIAALWLLTRATLAPAQGASAQGAAPPPSPRTSPLGRWLDVQQASLNVRYREVETSEGAVANNQIQHQQQFRLRLKADPAGRYALHVGIFSGRNFGSGWNNTGIGTGDPTAPIAVRQLFLAAQPLPGLELQVGSLYLWRGESTEITTYDNDGYLTGLRVVVRRPAQLFFDQVTYTEAHLGDVEQPNAFRRLDRLGDVNYRQAGLVKAIGPLASVSTDFTTHERIRTMRAAGRLRTPALRAIDVLRLEGYRRLNGEQEAGGFALAGERAITKRLNVIAGLSVIDRDYLLNGDRYDRGNHLYAIASYALTPVWTLQTFVARAVHTEFEVANGTRVDVVVNYNLLRALQQLRVLP